MRGVVMTAFFAVSVVLSASTLPVAAETANQPAPGPDSRAAAEGQSTPSVVASSDSLEGVTSTTSGGSQVRIGVASPADSGALMMGDSRV